MKFLIDTHVFLWLAASLEHVSKKALSLLEVEESSLYFSSISVWEIEQKFRTGKLRLRAEPKKLIGRFYKSFDVRPLAFDEEAVFMLEKLPRIHNDPFDRMLVCQAIQHNMTLVTDDRHMHQYPIKTLW